MRNMILLRVRRLFVCKSNFSGFILNVSTYANSEKKNQLHVYRFLLFLLVAVKDFQNVGIDEL